MKPTNKIKRHHYKSDCQIIERFYSYDDGTAVQVPVPERIKIEYYIDKGKGSIVVERKGNYCHNCSVSDDGMTLIAAIPLAKHPIGRGRLLCDKVEYIDDPLFPGGYKVKVTPMLTSIELWSQASDNDKSSAYGELLLAKIIRGKDGEGIPAGGKTGQILSKKSDNDFDTEWVDAPQGGGGTVDIVDNLTTADPTKALSANMGKVLNEKFQYKNYLAGKNLDQKGNILDADGWNVTTPIAVVGGTALTFECGGTNTSALCEYDADGNFLDYWGQNAHPRTITTRANTAYVRLAVPSKPIYDYYVVQGKETLFNQLIDYDLADNAIIISNEDKDVKTLATRKGDFYPRTKTKAVIDENGKDLETRLNELSSGGGEGAVIYNGPQTLTDEQKSQVAKNIGQPVERLILEWTNEKAEVLQPTAYDTETGYFTVESMPSWLAEDGAEAYGIINYADNVLCPAAWADAYGYIPMKSIPLPSGNEGTRFYVERVSESQIVLYTTSNKDTRVTIPSGVRCDGFYLTNELWVALKIPTLTGNIKYRLTINRAALRPSMYRKVGVQGVVGASAGDHTDGGLGYQTKHHFETNSVYEFVVDFDNMKYIMTRIECNGQERTNTTGGTQAFINPTLYGLYWEDIGNLPNSPTYVYINIDRMYINKYTIIKLYEITI